MAAKVLILEDHPMFSRGLTLSLKSEYPDLNFVGVADTEAKAEDLFRAHKPDLVIMDLHLLEGNALGFMQRIFHLKEHAQFILLSQNITEPYSSGLRRMGVHHQLNKTITTEEMSRLVSPILGLRRTKNPFSKREIEVIRLIMKGQTQKEIADCLQCSAETIKTHKSNIFKKVKVKNSAELVAWVSQNSHVLKYLQVAE